MKRLGLHRRTFLRGLGTLMALPMLEAMAPTLPVRRAHGEAVTSPKRVLFYYVPNGIVMEKWTPGQTGADFSLSPVLTPLAGLESELLVLSNLDCYPATDQGDGAGDHARGTGAFLTSVHVAKTAGSDIHNGPSIDQVLAQAQAGATRYRSLEVGIEPGPSSGSCDSGYSCAYSTNIAWYDAATPLAKETDVVALFNRLFSNGNGDESAEQTARRQLYRKSVLDFVLEDANTLYARVGSSDKQKLDQYFTGIRELERQLEVGTSGSCPMGEAPTSNSDLEVRVRQMSDLMVLAMQCDMTRILTFMQGNAGSNRNFPFLGIYQSHHELSHHQNDRTKIEKLERINVWELEMVRYLLDKMRAVQEPDGSLLDNSVVFFSSEIADGNAHAHLKLPVLLAGRLGGRLSPGRHVRYAEGTPIANLYMGLAERLGVSLDRFGDDGASPLGELG